MDKLGIIVALVALGVAGFAFTQVGEKDGRIDGLAQANSDLKDQVTALEVKLDRALAMDAPGSMLSADAAPETAGAPQGATLATRAPASPLERLAELEKTVQRQNEMLAKMESDSSQADDAAGMVSRRMARNFFFNADTAAKALELDEDQTADMQEILDRGKRELKDLYALENDEGLTWAEVRKPKMANLGGDGGGISIAMPDFARIEKFKKSRIPGTSETFGEAEKRIKERAFGDVRRMLPGDKTKTWDGAHKDNLLGNGGATFAVSSIQLGVDAK